MIHRHSFRFWIVSSILATVMLALIPVSIFIYSYGESITTQNLFDQLDVSLNDIMIRFEDSLGDFTHSLDDFVNQVEAGIGISLPEGYELPVSLNAILSLTDTEGNLLYSNVPQFPPSVDFASRIPEESFSGTLYRTDYRYSSYYSDEVVVNLVREVHNDDGSIAGYAFLDVVGTPYIRYADPALVNEVCLIDNATLMVSSLTHLDEYRHLMDGWVFSETLHRESGDLLISHRNLNAFGFTLVGYLDISPYIDSMNNFYALSIAIIAFACVLATILAVFLSSPMVKPMHDLLQAMERAEEGNLDIRVEQNGILEMDQLGGKFNEMLERIKVLMKNNEEERERVRDAERKALEAQLNPHFLFNTLNTIRAIARMHKETQIEDISIKLGRLLRYAVDNRESTETLENSFLMVESYLGIQLIRFQDRLHVETYLDERLKKVVTPKLIIQPLVENSVIHGLEPKIGQWNIRISARCDASGQRAIITVEDDGIGFDDAPFQNMEALEGSGHTGMYNVYKRLDFHYGKRASFKVQSVPGAGSLVILTIPLEEGESE